MDICTIDNKVWYVETLLTSVENDKLEVFEIKPELIDKSIWPWEKIVSINDMITHIKRVNNCDLSYPIILSDCGAVMDGFHRILSAILTNKTLLAVQFKKDPEPDYFKLDKSKIDYFKIDYLKSIDSKMNELLNKR